MRTTARHWRALAPFAIAACMLFSVSGSAQADVGTQRVTVEDRTIAAEAYDRGTSAFLSGHYEQAAHWFERAYRVAPTSAALLQAIRSHGRAGNPFRAANLALELRDAYPGDDRAQRAADTMIDRVAPTSVLVNATCESKCTLELDGALVRHPSFFVTPDTEHSLKAAFERGEASTHVAGSAGETKDVTLAAPSAPAPPPVPRWAFFSSLGATVALGAVTIWSGVDAKRGVAAYESAARTASSPGINSGGSPTPVEQAQSLLEEGRAKERRTNVLIGVTAGMAVTTAVLGVFTNWRGESRGHAKRIETGVGVSNRGGVMTVQGRF